MSLFERAELIKWWDALGTLVWSGTCDVVIAEGLQMARSSQHSDAQWLVSLFPAGVAVTAQSMLQVMLEHSARGDARATFFAFRFGSGQDGLQRAAEMGYAPAQVLVSLQSFNEAVSLQSAQKAAAGGYREGKWVLGRCLYGGLACASDRERGIELLREAAELDSLFAQQSYGELAFGHTDWQRYYWWGRASIPTMHLYHITFRNAALRLLPSFENGKLGRILHTVAPLIRAHLDVVARRVFGTQRPMSEMRRLQRLLELHEAMRGRARRAMDCWSMAGRRCGVVKDMRVMVGNMAWEELWRWVESQQKKKK